MRRAVGSAAVLGGMLAITWACAPPRAIAQGTSASPLEERAGASDVGGNTAGPALSGGEDPSARTAADADRTPVTAAASPAGASSAGASPAGASQAGASPAGAQPAAASPTPAPPPYAVPFTLRPAIAPQVIRLDTTVDASHDGVALVPTLTAAIRALPDLSPMVRIGMTSWFPSAGGDRSVFLSPLLGALYTPDAGHGLRPAFFAAVTLPLGSGEGSPAPADDSAALAAGRRGRASLDNALFATNYTVLIAGAGLAWLYEGLTIQLDLTLLHGIGSRAPVTSPYDDFTNVVASLWVAYTITPWLMVGAELRHQHFLDMPRAIAAAQTPTMPQQEYQTSLGGGVRVRIPIAGRVALPLGVSYTRGLDGWMWARDNNIVQIDLPLVF